MGIKSIEHVGIVVNDLPSAKSFFLELGFELYWEGDLEGDLVDKICGLDRVKSTVVFMGLPKGQAKLELIKFHRPMSDGSDRDNSANTLGIRHIAFVVEEIDTVVNKLKMKGVAMISDVQNYEGVYKLCYIRGPEGIILELAEKLN